MEARKVLKGLAVIVCLMMLLVPSVMAGPLAGLPCNGNFDGDQDVDANDVTEFLIHFGRSQYNDPFPAVPPAPVPKTRQETSYRSGDDGYHEKGVEWPGPRFDAHGNGTVTDNLTGLMWTEDAQEIPGPMTWNGAIDECNSLNYADYDDWRLPNVKELQSLIDFGNYNPALSAGHPFDKVRSNDYWSATTSTVNTGYAWGVYMFYGIVNFSNKSNNGYVWPVRGGNG